MKSTLEGWIFRGREETWQSKCWHLIYTISKTEHGSVSLLKKDILTFKGHHAICSIINEASWNSTVPKFNCQTINNYDRNKITLNSSYHFLPHKIKQNATSCISRAHKIRSCLQIPSPTRFSNSTPQSPSGNLVKRLICIYVKHGTSWGCRSHDGDPHIVTVFRAATIRILFRQRSKQDTPIKAKNRASTRLSFHGKLIQPIQIVIPFPQPRHR